MSTFGDNLKKYRLQKELTLAELGKMVNLSDATLQRYEAGVITNIPLKNIEKISTALRVKPEQLTGWVSNGYYINDETKQIAQEMLESPGMRALMDASRKLKPEDAKIVQNLIKSLSERESGNGDDDYSQIDNNSSD